MSEPQSDCQTDRLSRAKRRRLAASIAALCGALVITPGCGSPKPELDPAADPAADSRIKPAAVADRTTKPPPKMVVQSRDEMLEDAAAAIGRGDLKAAESLMENLLVRDPADIQAIFGLAQTRYQIGRIDDAIELLGEIGRDEVADADAKIAALGISAQWCVEAERYGEAADRYDRILQLAPDLNQARRELAFIENRRGNRHDAGKLVRDLVRRGDVTQDELHSLIAESDAMHDEPNTATTVPGERRYLPISSLAAARLAFTNHRYAEAASILADDVLSGHSDAAASALYGRAVIEAQDDQAFQQWLATADPSVPAYPDYWAAVGAHWMSQAKYQEGLAALGRAVVVDPTDIRSTRRVVQAFRALGLKELATKWTRRYEALARSVTLGRRVAAGDDQAITELAGVLESLGRNGEAIMWRAIALGRGGGPAAAMEQLGQERLALIKFDRMFPSPQQTLDGWPELEDPSSPIADLLEPSKATDDGRMADLPGRNRAATPPPARPAFRAIGRMIGLDHRYHVAVKPESRGFAIYQQNGGGVAAIDYDLDGLDDLYLAQGAADPPDFVGTISDQLFRMMPGEGTIRGIDQTESAGLNENRYTLGVTRGDWNQDGFPDLATANLGAEVLMINQGDGTFRVQAIEPTDDLTTLSTSIAMADMTGDHLPDLYVAQYASDSTLAAKPELDAQGYPIAPMTPHDFEPARDRVAINDGSGGWKMVDVGESSEDESYSLGLVIGDFGGQQPGNQVFVANDAKANQLWGFQWVAGNDPSPAIQWNESAVTRGLAFGSLGSATAAMGVAAADFDRSGSMDLCITNFQNESSSLYLHLGSLFRDLNVKFGLDRLSESFLGFGTQPIDHDNNGWVDLVVANGHVDDLSNAGVPFRQRTQILTNTGGGFVDAASASTSPFFQQPRLGRSVAVLDVDRDGMADFVQTDLLGISEVLLNETPNDHHWLAIRLVGTASERDAIGAHVQVVAGDQSGSHRVVAGDGYLGRNSDSLMIGLGGQDQVESIEVRWPSGLTQSFVDPPIDAYLLVIESQDSVHVQEHPAVQLAD